MFDFFPKMILLKSYKKATTTKKQTNLVKYFLNDVAAGLHFVLRGVAEGVELRNIAGMHLQARGSWWLSPTGSKGARQGQPHEPQLIHTADVARTFNLLSCTYENGMEEEDRDYENQSGCETSVMLIRRDMLIILKSDM